MPPIQTLCAGVPPVRRSRTPPGRVPQPRPPQMPRMRTERPSTGPPLHSHVQTVRASSCHCRKGLPEKTHTNDPQKPNSTTSRPAIYKLQVPITGKLVGNSPERSYCSNTPPPTCMRLPLPAHYRSSLPNHRIRTASYRNQGTKRYHARQNRSPRESQQSSPATPHCAPTRCINHSAYDPFNSRTRGISHQQHNDDQNPPPNQPSN